MRSKRISTRRLKKIIWDLMRSDFAAETHIGEGESERMRKQLIDGSILGKGAVLEAIEIWEEDPRSPLLKRTDNKERGGHQ